MQILPCRPLAAPIRVATNQVQQQLAYQQETQEAEEPSESDNLKRFLRRSTFQSIRSIRILFILGVLSNLIQIARTSNEQRILDSPRVFVFLERYHYPVISDSCAAYKESDMISSSTDEAGSIFQERFIIFQAVKAVIGQNSQIIFKCVESYSSDNTDDPQNKYAGKFGSDISFYLDGSDYYQSVPDLHFEMYNIQKHHIKEVASFSVFEYLNYLFYLGIFLIPAITGLILLLFKDLTTFYDYQRVVYSVFRYLNRQGDQQMSHWLHKMLSLVVALFFFFYYSILLSEMTAKRRFSVTSTDVNRDLFRDIQNYSSNFTFSDPTFSYLSVDSYQYDYLQNSYEINDNFQDPSINHYNILFSKNYFSEQEYNLLFMEILRLSASQKDIGDTSSDSNTFNNRSDDIYYNWLILVGAVLAGLIFKILQLRFSSLNQYTEIQGFREQVNRDIALDFGELFRFQISKALSNIQAKDHFKDFKQIPISKKCQILGKQVYKVIEKRRKKMKLHKKRKFQHIQASTNGISKQKQNLYQTIKEYLSQEKKAKVNSSTPRSSDFRRYALQATIRSNPFSTTNDALLTQIEMAKLQQSKPSGSIFDKSNYPNILERKQTNAKPNSFNSLKDKPNTSQNQIGGKISSFNKAQGSNQRKMSRRLSNLVLSTNLHLDTPKEEKNGGKNALEPIKQSESRPSSPSTKKSVVNPLYSQNGFSSYIQDSQVLDGSNRHRRRGTNNILNPIQLLSLRKYDIGLHKKHQKHTPGKKSKSMYFEREFERDYDEEEEENHSDTEKVIEHNFNGEENEVESQTSIKNNQEQLETTNNNHNNKNNNEEENQKQLSIKSASKNNFMLEDNQLPLESPFAQNTETTPFYFNANSEPTTNRYSTRFENLQTEERTETEDRQINLNLFDSNTNNLQKFMKLQPLNVETSAFNHYPRIENLQTEDRFITQENEQDMMNTQQSEFAENFKTPVKSVNPSPFQGVKK